MKRTGDGGVVVEVLRGTARSPSWRQRWRCTGRRETRGGCGQGTCMGAQALGERGVAIDLGHGHKEQLQSGSDLRGCLDACCTGDIGREHGQRRNPLQDAHHLGGAGIWARTSDRESRSSCLRSEHGMLTLAGKQSGYGGQTKPIFHKKAKTVCFSSPPSPICCSPSSRAATAWQ